MNVKLISLTNWIDEQYKSYPSFTDKKKKESAAITLGCGISTLYRWLASGNVFIEEIGSDQTGDGGGLVVWKCGDFIS